MRHWTIHLMFLLLMAAIVLASGATSIAEIPDELETIVFGDEKRESFQATVNGIEFEALNSFSEYPYLLWPNDESKAASQKAITKNRLKLAVWLNDAANDLGFDGFKAHFNGLSDWRGNEVLNFELKKNGLKYSRARVEVHFSGDRFLGIVNHIPGKIRKIQKPDRIPGRDELVYHAQRNKDGSFDLIPAMVRRTARDIGTDVVLTTLDGKELTRTVIQAPENPRFHQFYAEFKEYNVPVGQFPDQISVDDNGIVWFSQPSNDYLTEFDPVTESFTQHATTGGTSPDGMIVGSLGRVWSGMYDSNSLGVWDSVVDEFRNYTSPYAGANLAVPVETSDGSIWVTDHISNRVSEFDPVNETWLQSIVLPTPNSWVVQGYEDQDHGQIYFTEYSSNQLGKIAVGGSVFTDIPTPGGGPAFCVYRDNKVYYSRWTEAGMGVYDVNTKQITEYEFPVAGESGGPMWIAPNGNVVFGTRNAGYVMVFWPETEKMRAYKIPTNSPGLKDGMTVGEDGVIWLTESGANKIAKLTFRRRQ